MLARNHAIPTGKITYSAQIIPTSATRGDGHSLDLARHDGIIKASFIVLANPVCLMARRS